MRLLQAGTALGLRSRLRPRQVVLVDERGELTAEDLHRMVALLARPGTSPPSLADLSPEAPLRRVLAVALAARGNLELRSSGTTGEPRLQRRGPLSPSQLRTLLDLARRTGLRPGTRVASAAPGVHGHGLMVALGALALGAPLVDLSHLRAGPRVCLLEATSPAVLTGVPVHLLDVLTAHREHSAGRPLRIARVVSGSDVLSSSLRADLARHFRARVHDVYGTTETGTISVDGRPLRGVRIREQDGLLHVRTPFTAGHELVTDRGRIGPGGRIVVLGRADGAVSSGGMLHHPQAVARLIATHPQVASVRMRLVEDERFGTRTIAEVTLRPSSRGSADHGQRPSSAELRALVRDALGAAAVPREVVLVEPGLSSPGGSPGPR